MRFFNKISVVFLAFFTLVSLACAGEKEIPQFIEGTVRVSAEDVIKLFEKHDDLVLINSRKKSELKHDYIESSINLPYTDTYGSTLRKYISDKTSPVVFYCDDAKRDCSVKAAKIAAAEGYLKVFWFRGGVQEWKAKGLPTAQP